MTIEEAIRDPRRPLSLSPRDWALSVEAELEEEKTLIQDSSRRIASEELDHPDSGRDPNAWEKIDMGLDQMVEGCKILDQGLLELEEENLSPASRKTISSLREIVSRALIPYLGQAMDVTDGASER